MNQHIIRTQIVLIYVLNHWHKLQIKIAGTFWRANERLICHLLRVTIFLMERRAVSVRHYGPLVHIMQRKVVFAPQAPIGNVTETTHARTQRGAVIYGHFHLRESLMYDWRVLINNAAWRASVQGRVTWRAECWQRKHICWPRVDVLTLNWVWLHGGMACRVSRLVFTSWLYCLRDATPAVSRSLPNRINIE